MKKTIRVTGKGQLKLKPDRMRIILTLEETSKIYDKVLQASAEKTEMLRTLIAKLGISEEDLKTTSFNVEMEYENFADKNGIWKRRFKGYKGVHALKLELASDNELLGKLLYQLGRCSAKPELQIEYTISDPESAKNELLARAVADAKKKAAILAGAASVSLGDIVTIDYSIEEPTFTVRPVERLAPMKCSVDSANGAYPINIAADDISVSETVTVIWGINK